jgi:hypothetical protein
MSTEPPGPRSGITGDNVAAARADVSGQAKRNLKHKIKAKKQAAKAAAKKAKK